MNKVKIYINYLLFLVCLLIPKKRNRWVFGAWFGSRISDNPYALYQYIKKTHPNIECIWVCDDIKNAKRMGVKAVRRNTISAAWKCITARVSVMNQGYLDFGDLNWIQRSFKVQLWHGVPWKKIGEDTKDSKTGLFHRISHNTYLLFNKYDLYIAPSDVTRKVLKTAFRTDDNHIFSVGQPRNEMLMNPVSCFKSKNRLYKKYGNFDVSILYMPTFRDMSEDMFSFFDISDDILPILEEHNAVLLEKQHYVQKLRRDSVPLKQRNRIFNVEEMDTQELLTAADILVTDYSSCYFDFLLRDKPIIHYIYDYDNYKNKDRGLYYDIDYVVAGKAVRTQRELLLQIEMLLNNEVDESEKRRIIRNRFDSYESPSNSKILFKEIMRRIH